MLSNQTVVIVILWGGAIVETWWCNMADSLCTYKRITQENRKTKPKNSKFLGLNINKNIMIVVLYFCQYISLNPTKF